MSRMIGMRRGTPPGSVRCVCVLCFLLAFSVVSISPVYAVTGFSNAEIPGLDQIAPNFSSELTLSAAAADNGSPANEQDIGDSVLAAPEVSVCRGGLEKAGNIAEPSGAFIVGQSHPVEIKPSEFAAANSKMSNRLITLGLLMIPFDAGLAKSIPHIPDGHPGDGLTKAINSLGTPGVLVSAIGGMYLLGDKDDKDTAKLALASLMNAAFMTGGLKVLTGRGRPTVVGDAGEFEGPGAGKGYTSFPSGHTSAAFAVATVLASKHPKQKWLYYGLAAAVGLARVRESCHLPSDVLVGAGIGIYVGNSALRHGPQLLRIKL